MSEYSHEHPEFTCRGPLTEAEAMAFSAIEQNFLTDVAEAPSLGMAASGEPSYEEFASVSATDYDGNATEYAPVRLHGYRIENLVPEALSAGLENFNELTVGASTKRELFNAGLVLHSIGALTNAATQPDHERLS